MKTRVIGKKEISKKMSMEDIINRATPLLFVGEADSETVYLFLNKDTIVRVAGDYNVMGIYSHSSWSSNNAKVKCFLPCEQEVVLAN